MKKENQEQMKENKGITLIALVVTIVVLLILAGITISTLFGDNGIISAARKAADDTARDQINTEQGLQNLEGQMIDKLSDGTWKDNGNGTFTCSSKTVTIGDYVTYNPGSHNYTPDTSKGEGTSYTSVGGQDTPAVLATSQLTTQSNFTSWRVLGVSDKGQLELISSDPTSQTLYLANATGYLNAEDNLNNFCNDLYGKGTITKDGKTIQIAESARSLSVKDIDKITKYDKTTYSGYGEKWQYQFPLSGSYIQYRKKGTATNATWSSWTDTDYQKFRMPGSTEVINSSNKKEGPELEYTYYNYSIASNITTADEYTSELATIIGNMITKGTGTSNINQWLASCCIDCYSGCANFGVRCVFNGNVRYINLSSSDEYYLHNNCRVRPVVSLTSGVKLTGTGENPGTASNPYTLDK